MEPLPLPSIGINQILDKCIDNVKNPILKSKIQSIKQVLLSKADEYHQKGASHSLHLMIPGNIIPPASKKEMKELYSVQLKERNNQTIKIYQKLRKLPANRRCPYCNIGDSDSLDHYLPKGEFPDLSICPWNLIPSCFDCNKIKGEDYPKNAGEQIIHPYYDDFSGEQWVFAKLNTQSTLSMLIQVDPPKNWSVINQSRIKKHFETFDLETIYSANANNELISLRENLKFIDTFHAREAHIQGEINKNGYKINSWQYAMYENLSSNHWFIEKGYKKL